MVAGMKAETFFSESDKAKISGAIAQVEKTTAGEIAVMVVDQSDDYPAGPILAGLTLGGIPALLLSDFFGADSIWIFLPLFLVFGLGCGWLSTCLPSLKRIFISKNRQETRVREKALTAFYDKGLYKTRDETGVLFFISLFEHRVWILADKGIYAKIEQTTLQEYAQDIAAGIKNQNATVVLCQEIENVGRILAEHFPIKADDANELSNELLVG
jgi:putative membrane protein